ncbi:MAG: precorrin-8X methylmutase [Actinomycetota bacterium]|nr:precorrin-8X methylmutase [Actinomycetota bacterium]
MTSVHPIEAESYRILQERVDLSRFGPLAAAVVARVIHASADLDYAETMVVDEAAVRVGVLAIASAAPVVADVEMVRHGISGVAVDCYLAEVGEAAAGRAGLTRSAAAMRLAAERHPEGAVVVIGCAPTALEEAIRLPWSPALVIGLPVGFVGAAEAKRALRASGRRSISNVGEKGGSAVAAAAVNALVRLAHG